MAYSVGFWRPGQEVKLAPLFLTFFPENLINVCPKTNFGHFEKWKQKAKRIKKKSPQFVFIHLHTKLYRHFMELITNSTNLNFSLLLFHRYANICFSIIFYITSISAAPPPKWRPGHIAPPPSTPLAHCPMCGQFVVLGAMPVWVGPAFYDYFSLTGQGGPAEI